MESYTNNGAEAQDSERQQGEEWDDFFLRSDTIELPESLNIDEINAFLLEMSGNEDVSVTENVDWLPLPESLAEMGTSAGAHPTMDAGTNSVDTGNSLTAQGNDDAIYGQPIPPSTREGTASTLKRKNPPMSRKGLRYNGYLDHVPNRDFDFPAINVTVVELLTFLPLSFHNYCIANRLYNNGMDSGVHRYIVRRHRFDPPPPDSKAEMLEEDDEVYPPYSILKGYDKVMRLGPDPEHVKPDWKRGTHPKPKPDEWDFANISLAGCAPNRITHRTGRASPQSILLASLAQGVAKLPDGNDAADLTKAVRYAMDHSDEQLLYPDHVEALIQRLGSTPAIFKKNGDAVLIAKYKGRLADDRQQAKQERGGDKRRQTTVPSASPRQSSAASGVQDQQVRLLRDMPFPRDFDRLPLAQAIWFAIRPEQRHVDWANSPEHLKLIMQMYVPDDQVDVPVGPAYNEHIPGEHRLLRDSPWPHDKDKSNIAKAIRFAQRVDQYPVGWTNYNGDIQRITVYLDGGLLRDLDDPHPGEGGDLAISIRFSKRINQRNLDWRISDVRQIVESGVWQLAAELDT